MSLTTECISDLAGLGEDEQRQWDRLAIAAERPFTAPVVVAAAWRHMAPADAELQLIAVRQGEELVGLAPLSRVGRRYSWAGGQVMPGGPLARSGLEREVAAAIAGELAGRRPLPLSIEFELFGTRPHWSRLLRDGWPRSRRLLDRTHGTVAVPIVELADGGFDAWLEGLKGKVRGDVRRRRRRLEEAGGSLRFSDPSSLRRDVDELLRLHLDRHQSSVFEQPGAGPMLNEIGEALLGEDRFRLACVEIDGRIVGAQLQLGAGSRLTGFLSGYDEEFGRFAPNLVGILFLLEDLSERGGRTMSLGSGGQAYKYQFANSEEDLSRHYLLPLGPSGVGALALMAIRDRLPAVGGSSV